jgi:hypothetical protein
MAKHDKDHLTGTSGREARFGAPPLSQDAAIVIGLASTALPFATSMEDEAERWLRVMRLHGQVGAALQALGVPEAPLATEAANRPPDRRERMSDDRDAVEVVASRARDLARRRGAPTTGTLEVLFALLAVYGKCFDRALYTRGTSSEELLECLAKRSGTEAPTPTV